MRLSSPAIQAATLRLDLANPPSGSRVIEAQAQFGEQVGLQDRCRCAVATAQVAKTLGSLGIVAGEQLFDPSLLRKAVVPDTCEMV